MLEEAETRILFKYIMNKIIYLGKLKYMRFWNFVLISLFAILATSSCHKSPVPLSDPQPTPPTTSVEPDIYVAGTMSLAGATYWKNGVATYLVPDSSISVATGIAVQGIDVYVCGYIVEGNPGIQTALYWKNGVMARLGAGFANGIVIQGNDVYIAGTSIAGSKHQTAYWKNGVVNLLNAINPNTLQTAPYSSGMAIAVQGADVYVAGITQFATNGVLVASLWKNNNNAVFQTAYSATSPLASALSIANCIAVSGSDVYVGGAIVTTASGAAAIPNAPHGAVYWKNGTVTQLADSSVVNGVFLQGSDVYTCGVKNYYTLTATARTPIYWKNTIPTALPDLSPAATVAIGVVIPRAITLYNNDVYIAGDGRSAVNSSYSMPTYWKNGVGVELPTLGSRYTGEAYAIAIVPHQ